MTDEQLQVIRELHDDETRPTVSEPFYFGPDTYDALGAIVEEVEQLREQLRCQTKSFCTHCGKLFPKGKEGLAAFRAHVAACSAHPLHPMAVEIERLRAALVDAATMLNSIMERRDGELLGSAWGDVDNVRLDLVNATEAEQAKKQGRLIDD